MNRRVNRVAQQGMPEFSEAPPLEWLEEHHRFSYYDGSFRVSMRKEVRRGKRRFWYSYAKFGSHTVKVYAGTSEALDKVLPDLPNRLQALAEKKGLA